jgi:predicted DNA-binding transcriptional regulator AlpA
MNLVGIAEIAQIAGVSRQVVNNWNVRDVSFPRPIAQLACGQIWDQEEILAWLMKQDRLDMERRSVMPFKKWKTYTFNELSDHFKTSMQNYLPQCGSQIVCGLFKPDMNDGVPEKIWVGDKPIVRRKAELLLAQGGQIPVFIKQGSNQWLYYGLMEPVSFDTDSTLASHITEIAGRPVIGVLTLRPVEGTNKVE